MKRLEADRENCSEITLDLLKKNSHRKVRVKNRLIFIFKIEYYVAVFCAF
jgi:predicted nucleic acid-binding Zn ribbon protein